MTIMNSDSDIQQGATTRQSLEVGDMSYPEIVGQRQQGSWASSGSGGERLTWASYEANTSRRRRVISGEGLQLGIGKGRSKAMKTLGTSNHMRNYNDEPIGSLVGILWVTLLWTIVLGALLGIWIIGATLSEIEQWLEQWPICQEHAEVKKTQVSKRLEKKRGEEKSRTEKKEEEQWNTWDQSGHDTYEQERNIGQ